MSKLIAFLLGICLLLAVPHTLADIIESSATSLKTGKMESDESIFLLKEQSLSLPSEIVVNGTPADPMGETSGGTIQQGLAVQSWILHSDKIGNSQDRVDVSGSFDFGAPILGLVFLPDELDATDAVLGHAGVEYPTGAFLAVNGRYYRGTGPADTRAQVADVWELTSPTTLRINMQTNSVGIDQMRIITAIPEPTALGLVLLGALAVCSTRSNGRMRIANQEDGAGGRTQKGESCARAPNI